MNQLQIQKPEIQKPGLQRPENTEQPYDRYEDEINLIDLWLVLVRHKKIFLATFAGCALLGLIYALITPKTYDFTTSIEIGTRLQKEVLVSIEDPQTVLAKIQESYIPLALNEYRKTNPAENSSFSINTRIPKGSQIIVLQTKGVEESASTLLQLQQDVVEKIKQDHQRIIGIVRNEVEVERNIAINKFNELKDDSRLIEAKEKHVNDLEAFLKKQLGEEKSYLAKAEKSRQRAVKEATNEARAMTLLLIDSNIDNQRGRVADIQERLRIEIADKKDDFVKQLADNQREQANQKDQISRLETRLVNLRETRALVPPMQSNRPVGISRSMIVLLALFAGLIFGLFTAFFAGFLAKAKEQIQLQS